MNTVFINVTSKNCDKLFNKFFQSAVHSPKVCLIWQRKLKKLWKQSRNSTREPIRITHIFEHDYKIKTKLLEFNDSIWPQG